MEIGEVMLGREYEDGPWSIDTYLGTFTNGIFTEHAGVFGVYREIREAPVSPSWNKLLGRDKESNPSGLVWFVVVREDNSVAASGQLHSGISDTEVNRKLSGFSDSPRKSIRESIRNFIDENIEEKSYYIETVVGNCKLILYRYHPENMGQNGSESSETTDPEQTPMLEDYTAEEELEALLDILLTFSPVLTLLSVTIPSKESRAVCGQLSSKDGIMGIAHAMLDEHAEATGDDRHGYDASEELCAVLEIAVLVAPLLVSVSEKTDNPEFVRICEHMTTRAGVIRVVHAWIEEHINV